MITDRNHVLLGSMTSETALSGLDHHQSSSINSLAGNSTLGVIGSSSAWKAVGSGIGGGSSLMSSIVGNNQQHSQQQHHPQQSLLQQISSMSLNNSSTNNHQQSHRQQQQSSLGLGSLLSSNGSSSSVLSSSMSLTNQGFSASLLNQRDQQPTQTSSNLVHQSQQNYQQQYQSSHAGHAILGQGSTLSSNSNSSLVVGSNHGSSSIPQSPSSSYEFAVRLASEANSKANNDKDYYEAIKLYGKAICLDSRDSRFFLNRSYCYAQLELYQLALDDADSAIAIDNKSGKSYFRRGQALVGLRKFAEAEKSFQEVLKCDPECLETAKELINLRILALSSLGLDEDKIRSIPLNAPALELVLRQHSAKVLGWGDSSTTSNAGSNSWGNQGNASDQIMNNGLNSNTHNSKAVGSSLLGNSLSNSASWGSSSVVDKSFDVVQQQHQHESHFVQQQVMSGRPVTNTQNQQSTSSQSLLMNYSNQPQVQQHNTICKPPPQQQQIIGSQGGLAMNGGLGAIGSHNAWNRTVERPSCGSPQSNAATAVSSSLMEGTPASSFQQMVIGNNVLNNSSSTSSSNRGLTGALINSCHDEQQQVLFNRQHHLLQEKMSSSVSDSSCISKSSCAADQLLSSLNGSAINSFASAAAFNSQLLANNNNSNNTSLGQHHPVQTQTSILQNRHPSGGSSSGIGSSAEPPSISPSVSNTSSDGGVVSSAVFENKSVTQETKRSNCQQKVVPPKYDTNESKTSTPVSAWGSSSGSSGGGTFADIVKKKAAAVNSSSSVVKSEGKTSGWGDSDTPSSTPEEVCGQAIVNTNDNNGSSSGQSKRPTNIWGYNGLRVGNVSSTASKSSLHTMFSKFGRVKLIERITNKNVENQLWVFYDNSNSPVDAIAKYQGTVVPGISLNNSTPLRFYFAATDDQKDLKFSRPKQPQDNRGECYYWRTTNCFSRESCSLRHIPACKNIDAQVWMKMTRESSNSTSSN